jgi:predicted phosphodiesterase
MHGNDVAFEAVVADIERVGVNGYVCLGDALQGGPQPRQVLDRLRALDCQVVLGNSDEFLVRLSEHSLETPSVRQLEVREWSRAELGADGLSFIEQMPLTATVGLERARRLLAFHGSPRSNEELLLPSSGADVLAGFRGSGAAVLAGGHAHMQWSRLIDDALFVNPGSVGMPYDHYQSEENPWLRPIAEYALLRASGSGLTLEFRRVPFSLEALRDAVEAPGFPDANLFLANWLRHDGSGS